MSNGLPRRPPHPSPPGGDGHRSSADGKSETESSLASSHGSAGSPARRGLSADLRLEPGASPPNRLPLLGGPTGPRRNAPTPTSKPPARKLAGNAAANGDGAAKPFREVGAVRPQCYARPWGGQAGGLRRGGGGGGDAASRVPDGGVRPRDTLNRTLLGDAAAGFAGDSRPTESYGANGAAAGRTMLERDVGGDLQEQRTFFQDCYLEIENESLGCEPLGSYEDLYLGVQMRAKTSSFGGVQTSCVNCNGERPSALNLCRCESDAESGMFSARPKCPEPQGHASNPSASTARYVVTSSSPMAFSPVAKCPHGNPTHTGGAAVRSRTPSLGAAPRLERRTSNDESPLRSSISEFAYNSCIKKDCLAIISEIRRRKLQTWDSVNRSPDTPLQCSTALDEMYNLDNIPGDCDGSPMGSVTLCWEMPHAKAEHQQASRAASSQPLEVVTWRNTTVVNNSNQKSVPSSTDVGVNTVSTAFPDLQCGVAPAASGCAGEAVAVVKVEAKIAKALPRADMDCTRMAVDSQRLDVTTVTGTGPAMTAAEKNPLDAEVPKRFDAAESFPGEHTLYKDKRSPGGPSQADVQKTSIRYLTTSTPLLGDDGAKCPVPAVLFPGDNDLGELSSISSASLYSLNSQRRQQKPDLGKQTLPASRSRFQGGAAAKAPDRPSNPGRATTDKALNVKGPLKVVPKAWSLDVQHTKLTMANPNASMERVPDDDEEAAGSAVANLDKLRRPARAADLAGRCGANGDPLPSRIKTAAAAQAKGNPAAAPAVASKPGGLPAYAKRAPASLLHPAKPWSAADTPRHGTLARPKWQASDPSKSGASAKICTPRKAPGCPHLAGDGPQPAEVRMFVSLVSSPRAAKPPPAARAAHKGPPARHAPCRLQASGAGEGRRPELPSPGGLVKARALAPWVGAKPRVPARPGGRAEPAPARHLDANGSEEEAANLARVVAENGSDAAKVSAGCPLQASNASVRPAGPAASLRARSALRPHSLLPACRGATRLPASRGATAATAATAAAVPRSQQDNNPNNIIVMAAGDPATGKAVAPNPATTTTTTVSSQRRLKLLLPPPPGKRSPSQGSVSVASSQSTDTLRAAKHVAASQVPAGATLPAVNTSELPASVTGASRPANRPLACYRSQPEPIPAPRGPDELVPARTPEEVPLARVTEELPGAREPEEVPATRGPEGDRSAERSPRRAEQLLARGATASAALAIALWHYAAKHEKLSGKLTELNLELKNVHQQLATQMETCSRLEQEKEREAAAALAGAERRHAEALSGLEAALHEQFRVEMEQLQQSHEQELDAMRAAQQTQELLLETERETVTELKKGMERSISELNQSFQSERTSMKTTFGYEKSSLEEKVKVLTMQIKAHSLEITNIGKHLNNTPASKGSPQSPVPLLHMEDELNSLKAVVDIRTQQVHTLEHRLLVLQQEADAKRVLEEKMQILQQQNEDMKARMDKSMEVTRQLSTEQMVLQASLQREAKAKQRLSMEKEQLMWKLQNGGSPAVSPSSPPCSPETFFTFQSNTLSFSSPR